MTLAEKESYAVGVIRSVLSVAQKPAFMCSFGKDSMVLLHILQKHGIKVPLIFHKDPWFPKKYAFADGIVAEYELEVYDYPPFAVTMWEGESIMAFTNHYQIGDISRGAVLQLPKNILPPEEGKKWLCGLTDVLRRPTGNFSYPWDFVFIGHKDSDEDQIAGKVTLHCDIKNNGGNGPSAAFPLRHFTDADIWDYTEIHGVPQQEDRYDVKNRKEWPNKETNSDYANVCIACIDSRKKGQFVECPKLNGLVISNASDMVPYMKPNHDYYGAKK